MTDAAAFYAEYHQLKGAEMTFGELVDDHRAKLDDDRAKGEGVAELKESKESRARILEQFLPLCFDWGGRVVPLSQRYLQSIPLT